MCLKYFCSKIAQTFPETSSVARSQETKFKDAIRHYDPIVKRLQDSLIDITAIVLANLCVSDSKSVTVNGYLFLYFKIFLL